MDDSLFLKMQNKICSTCKKLKPEDAFYRRKQYKEGRDPTCKQCRYEGKIRRNFMRIDPNRKEKTCWKCGVNKDINSFYRTKYTTDRHTEQCTACFKEYYKRTPEVYRKSHLKGTFGMTLEDYDKKFQEQKGRCEICGAESPGPSSLRKHFPIDHNHVTGQIRGLLCHMCNHLLGDAREDKDILLNAIEYLSKYKESS